MKAGQYTALLAAATLLAASAQAVDIFWSANTSGDWSNAANWGGDVPDTIGENAYFGGPGCAINLDADFTASAMRANFTSQNTTNTLSGPGTLTIGNSGNNILGFGNQAGGSGGYMLLNANMVVNNTGGNQLTQVRNDNSAGNTVEFSAGSTLTLHSPLVMLTGAGGSIKLNGTLAPSTSYLVVQNDNTTFNAGHDSSAFGQNIAYWGSNRKLTVNGGTVLSSSQKFSIQGTGSELELNGANAINGANLEILSTHAFLLDVNSDQQTMGAVSLADGLLTIDVDAGVTDLFFADSSAQAWGAGTVAINGFEEGVIKFGSDASGLTAAQLSAIDGGIYGLTETGYLTVIPEPGTIALLAIGGLGLYAKRRLRV